MEKNYAKKQRGITLIALVVTIVVLLILAGVSINMVLGNNGIVTKAKEARTANSHSTVYEAMQLQYDNYYTESTIGENDADFINDLKGKSILDESMNVNVETLIGKKLSTGNGSNLKDVYVVEQDETDGSYRLKYYGNNESEDKDLGIIGYEKEGADEPTDTDIFDFNPVTGEISLKYAECGYFRSGETVYEASDSGVTKLKKIVVPSEINGVKVTTIGRPTNDSLYIGLSSPYVEEIVLPETIKKVNCGAFAGCINLKKINIPDSVTDIWGYAFWYCRSLESLNMPDSVNGLLGKSTLTGCASLKNIKLSKNIEIIDEEFSGLTSLQGIDIDNDAINYMTEDGILYNKYKTELICFPYDKQQENYVVPESVVTIVNGIESKNIKSITLSKNVSEIEKGFVNCINLEMVNVDNDNQYYLSEDGVLFDKDKTNLLYYPENKKEESYTIPTSVTVIGNLNWINNRFSTNKNLKNITITKNVTQMFDDFSYCENLQNINVDSENQSFASDDGVLFDKDKSVLIVYPRGKTQTSYTIPEGVESLVKFNCINLKELIIPSSVSFIMNDAFSGCNNVHITVAAGSSLNENSFWWTGLSDSQIADITFE